MPPKSLLLDPPKSAEDSDENFFKLTERRKAFAASNEKIEQPRLIPNNAPPQSARKDTALPQSSPKASPATSEDNAEF